MKEVHAIVDLQFGSCGKGLFAGYLAGLLDPDTIVTAWAPNAGHTFIDAEGRKYVNIATPNGIATSKSLKRVLLGPGSVINPMLLLSEMARDADLWHGVDLMIHQSAAVVTDMHRQLESEYGFGIGSTMKGVGEAVIQKIRRKPVAQNVAAVALRGTPLESFVVDSWTYNEAIDKSTVVLIEGAQGFSLSINQGFYPYTTSRDCTIHQLLSDCAIPRVRNNGNNPKLTVYGVCRTHPIRVSNRYDKNGVMVGTSGPGYPDQTELEWSGIGRAAELTTVTQLPRRLFTFSKMQIEDAIRMNGVDHVFLNFANYITNRNELNAMVHTIGECGAMVKWLGHGPKVTDIEVI